MPQVIGSSMETVFSSMKHSTEMDLNGFHRSGGGSKSDTFRTLLNGTREETETDVRDAIHEAFLNNHVMRTYARSDERSSRPASAPAKPGGRGKLKLTSHKKRQGERFVYPRAWSNEPCVQYLKLPMRILA
jgi:hypothetical protein